MDNGLQRRKKLGGEQACALVMVMGLAASAYAQVGPGSILVLDADKNTGAGEDGALFAVDLASGARTMLSDFGDSAQGETGTEPTGVAIDVSGNIYVVDAFASGKPGFLFRVNPTTGKRDLVSDFADPGQGFLGSLPVAVAVDVSNILVLDEEAGGSGVLFGVDPATGSRIVISDFRNPAQGPLSGNDLRDLAVGSTGDVFVLDRSGPLGLRGRLFKVDPSSGVRSLVSYFGDSEQGTLVESAEGLAVAPSGAIWVTDSQGGTAGRGALLRVDPANGSRTLVSDFGDAAKGPLGIDPADLTIGPSGAILVADLAGGQDTADRGVLFSVDPATGNRTIVSDFNSPSQGERGVELRGVAVAAPSALPAVDPGIADMEITQAVQDLANNAGLVQDKATYVRVYPKVDLADRRAGARLRGFRGGAELPDSPLRPLYPLASVHPGGASRSTLNDSFNFWVPPAWRSGNVSFQAEINAGGAIPETNASNNSLRVSKEFTRKAPVCVVMVPVRTHGTRYTVDSPGFDSIIARFHSLWPVPEVWVYSQSEPVEELQATLDLPPFEFGPYELPDDGWKILVSLIARDTFTDDPDECDGAGARTHYVGMVGPDTETGGIRGKGNYFFAVSWVKMTAAPGIPFSTPVGGVTMAHELSHNYNGLLGHRWKHVACPMPGEDGAPDDINPDYPYPTNTLGPSWGFDPISKEIIDPSNAQDYMSYCSRRWVSDYTWRGMIGEIGSRSLRSNLQPLEGGEEPSLLDQSAEILVVGGAVLASLNTVSFEYSYRLTQNVLSERKLAKLQASLRSLELPEAVLVLQLLDAKGSPLFEQPFNSTPSYDGATEEVFFLAVPFAPGTARIRILRNGQELGSLPVSSHAPQVKLLAPAGGETIVDRLTIRWEAQDEDNDPLLFTVQYSADSGDTWQALITGSPETTHTLTDTLSLPGSDRHALVRVIANDGVNTGIDTSDPFSVSPHPPVPHIDTPGDGSVFAPNTQIILAGGARDTEDGPLGAEGLTWFVDDELLGTGREVAVAGLVPGTYVVVLKAEDSAHMTATTSVTIRVGDRSAPVASADGYSLEEDTILNVAAPGLLANDTDPEGDALSAMMVTSPSHGTLELNANGSFTYKPFADFNGNDSFTYKASDGSADSNIVLVSLTITGILDFEDCNANGVPDDVDIGAATSADINGDGVPDECQITKLHFVISGTAQGGTASVTLAGFTATCTVSVITTAGQSAATVATSLAAAINGDACMSGQGIIASSSGATLQMEGFLLQFIDLTLADAGLQHDTSVIAIPALTPLGVFLMTLLLALAGIAVRLRQRRGEIRRPASPSAR